MKNILTIFIICSISGIYAQSSGTIKVAKPTTPEKKDTVIPPKRYLIASIGGNYTFKGIDKAGFEAEVFYGKACRYIGLGFLSTNEYFPIQPYDTEKKSSAYSYTNSVNTLEYIQFQLGGITPVSVGTMKIEKQDSFRAKLAITGSYLLKASNQYGRLSKNDFLPFDLAINIGYMKPIFRKKCTIDIMYSKSLLAKLKDNNIYGDSGTILGKYRSRTDMLSIRLSYWLNL